VTAGHIVNKQARSSIARHATGAHTAAHLVSVSMDTRYDAGPCAFSCTKQGSDTGHSRGITANEQEGYSEVKGNAALECVGRRDQQECIASLRHNREGNMHRVAISAPLTHGYEFHTTGQAA